jgi:hypothetical protein
MRRKAGSLLLLVFVIFSLIHIAPACASSNPLDTLFGPLRDLDIVGFYESSNHFWVDFFIYLCLFIAVSRLTLGRRFEGREGRVLSVVVGLVLALSLSLMEVKMDFSIRSFGPIAAGILIFLMGLVIFYLVRSVGAGNSAAGSIALLTTYFLIRATAPNFFLWLEENSWAAWVHLALLVAVVISFWKMVGSFRSRSNVGSLGRSLERSHDPNLDLGPNVSMERNERSLIKSRLERITKKGIREGREIIEDLYEISNIIEEYGDTDHSRHLIAEKLNHISPRENLILKQLAYLKDLSQRIERFDLKSFNELKSRWDKVPEKDRNIVKEEILLEKNKILSEEKLRELEKELVKYDQDFRYDLNMAVANLRSNQPGQAREWISKAIKAEEEAMNIFKEMKSMEDKLLRLTKVEFRTLKKEAKEER